MLVCSVWMLSVMDVGYGREAVVLYVRVLITLCATLSGSCILMGCVIGLYKDAFVLNSLITSIWVVNRPC